MEKNTPRHKVVYETIREDIISNFYKIDSLLPSENEMCVMFGVTRPTVRQALNRLEAEGYIIKQQGKGSIVQKIPQGMGILSVNGVTQAMSSQGKLKTKMLKKPVVEDWPREFAFNLSEKQDLFKCISMRRVRLMDKVPIIMENTYLVNTSLDGFCNKNFKNGSLFDTLRIDYDVQIVSGRQNIRASLSDSYVSGILNIPKDTAIIHMERKIKTNKSDLYIFSELFCYTDDYYIIDEF